MSALAGEDSAAGGQSSESDSESGVCAGADDLCGAPAGVPCEPGCPSWVADPPDPNPCVRCGTEASVCDAGRADGIGRCCAACTVKDTHVSGGLTVV